ncbi:MAG TPA: polyprenyl synthetase family protein [Thermoanaerobaculia bacterium]|nr:polyprenyl synthetase family protein [Thermoanaerobaculia bacterium]
MPTDTATPAAAAAHATGQLAGQLAEWAGRVDRHLPSLLPAPSDRPEAVHRAMHYALTSPGKRVRPVLTLAVAGMFGVRAEPVLDLACGVEMVHACSLVLDDLPSMDDANLRRGRPTVHRAFGENVALLAALGLLNRAYALVAEGAHRLALRRYTAEDMIHHLAAAIGSEGLIGGQALDLLSRPEELDLELLEYIHSHKTGALFMAAGELGAMAADAKRRDLEVVSRYAKNLGLAFQISDDLLDVLSTPEETGKDTGKDTAKVTFVKLLGVAGAQALAEELLGFAVESLAPLGRKADPLRGLALFVRHRTR